MTLKNEQWYVWDAQTASLRLATQEEINAHFAGRKPDENYWYNDHS